MAVKDSNILPTAKIAEKELVVRLVTATSQTAAKAFAWTPGYPFVVTGVQSYCSAKAGTITAAVKVGSVYPVSTVSFTAGAAPVAQTLSTTGTDNRGSATDQIDVEYTSDGSGSLTNGHVIITFRPHPLNGEVYAP